MGLHAKFFKVICSLQASQIKLFCAFCIFLARAAHASVANIRPVKCLYALKVAVRQNTVLQAHTRHRVCYVNDIATQSGTEFDS
jgi:hypothetical protein